MWQYKHSVQHGYSFFSSFSGSFFSFPSFGVSFLELAESQRKLQSTCKHEYPPFNRDLQIAAEFGIYIFPRSLRSPHIVPCTNRPDSSSVLVTAVHSIKRSYREHSQNLFPLLGPGFITTNVSRQQGLAINRNP